MKHFVPGRGENDRDGTSCLDLGIVARLEAWWRPGARTKTGTVEPLEPERRVRMNCTGNGAAVNGRGGRSLSKVPRVWCAVASEEEVSIV